MTDKDLEMDDGANGIEITDDEIFCRKFHMDGLGDDRRFNHFLRNFLSWYEDHEETDNQIDDGYENLLSILSICEHQMAKSQQTQIAHVEELKHYDIAAKDIEKNISEAEQLIKQRKVELNKAKVVLEHKQLYHNLAKSIAIYPSRNDLKSELNTVTENINDLHINIKQLKASLDESHKKLNLVLHSVHGVKEELDYAASVSDIK